MAEHETSNYYQSLIIPAETDPPAKPRKKRIASLDIFRGLAVALMVFVDHVGEEWPVLNHAPWNGCNLADFAMPFFLFIVGMAIPLALKRIPHKGQAVKKVILRTIKLLFWAYFFLGFLDFSPGHSKLAYAVDVRSMRLCGWWEQAYLYCICLCYMDYMFQTGISLFGKILSVTCGVRGKLNPPCNAVGYIDRQVLGINHMFQYPEWKRSEACTDNSPYSGPFRVDAPSWCYAPFEPEGILSSVSAILSTIIGVHFGHALILLEDHFNRLKHWLIVGFALLITGVDVCGLKYPFLPLKWIGLNSMLVFVMASGGIFEGLVNGWYYKDPQNTLVNWIKQHIFIGAWHSQRIGILLYVILAEILFWAIVAGILHRIRIYWTL